MFFRLPLKDLSAVLFFMAATISWSSPSAAQAPASGSATVASASDQPKDAHAKPTEYQEDMSTITLDSSALFPVRPALGQTDDDPLKFFIRERWQLMWRPADALDVYICKPRSATITKLPVILYLYGFPSDTERFKGDAWCEMTTKGGFAAVGFLSANTGHRLDTRPVGTTFFNDFQTSLGATVHDVQMLLNYLATRDDLDMSRVGMFGQGTGASIGILASAADPRIKALDLLTSWGSWPEFFATTPALAKNKRDQFTASEYLAKVAKLDPIKWLPQIKAKSLRMQDVRGQGPMTDALLDDMEAAAPGTAVIRKFGDQSAFASHTPYGVIASWLEERLQPNPKPLPVEKTERIVAFPAEAPANPLGVVPTKN
jgi:hypothetical protein